MVLLLAMVRRIGSFLERRKSCGVLVIGRGDRSGRDWRRCGGRRGIFGNGSSNDIQVCVLVIGRVRETLFVRRAKKAAREVRLHNLYRSCEYKGS